MTDTHSEDENKRICDEFVYLLDRAQQLFSGLRDLSDFGRWETYFQRTFEIYTKLWKFQQEHRAVLESKDRYGLQRWEIGEIASKIGQLYYHYYLRTSDTNYLEEAFLFYDAIRTRQYFKGILKIKNSALLIKELRYYARFIVVCLLLEKMSFAKELAGELTQMINDYVKHMKPHEMQEWQLVLQEITLFLQADYPVHIKDAPPHYILPSRRRPRSILNRENEEGRLKLQSAILVGSHQHQVKFSELSLDLFRMVLTLELQRPTASEGTVQPATKNPRKFLLYRPTVSTLLLYLASAHRELRDDGVLLLYLSADGERSSIPVGQKGKLSSYSKGGVKLRPERSPDATSSTDLFTSKSGFYPNDVLPFLRKPMFLIVDSDNSTSFLSLSGNTFGAPVFIIASPVNHPVGLLEPSQTGSLFTWFLHDPLSSFYFTVSKTVLSYQQMQKCQEIITKMFNDLEETLYNASDIPHAAALFIQDDFLRMLMSRFIFCHAVSDIHLAFREANVKPSSYPTLPDKVLKHPSVYAAIYDMADVLGVSELFAKV